MEELLPWLLRWLPSALVLVLGGLVLFLVDWALRAREARSGDASRIGRQLTMLGLTALLVVVFILSLDIDPSQKNQLLSLLGLLLSGAIALSSTTFLGNAIAGLMLRAVGDFRPGDFIQVGDRFGRVSERGLLHVEIQTEDRDLVTLPNLHVVSNPVKVVRASGTIVSAEVSLGYDVDHVRVEQLMLIAAEAAGLSDAFVRIRSLGDFSVSYRVSGFLKEVATLITVRSRLNAAVLDALHGGGVEIVSPTFMNQRQLPEERRFLADPSARAAAPAEAAAAAPEAIVFDKAESAALREQLQQRHDQLVALRAELAQGESEGSEGDRERKQQQIAALDGQIERLALALAEGPEADADRPQG